MVGWPLLSTTSLCRHAAYPVLCKIRLARVQVRSRMSAGAAPTPQEPSSDPRIQSIKHGLMNVVWAPIAVAIIVCAIGIPIVEYATSPHDVRVSSLARSRSLLTL